MQFSVTRLIVVIGFFINTVSSQYIHSTHPIQLKKANFSNELSANNYLVVFYKTWCPYYQAMRGAWEELAKEKNNLDNGRVKIGEVDCGIEEEVCQNLGVSRSPTIVLFKTKNHSSEHIEHKGGRDVQSLKTFLDEQLGVGPSLS